MGHAYILKSYGQPFVSFESCPLSYGSLTFVEFLHLSHFLRNHKSQSYETLVMHKS